MKHQYKNFYFTSGQGLNIIYDFERNRIISISNDIDTKKIFNSLIDGLPKIEINLTNEEDNLYEYLQNNVIDENGIYKFNSFEHFENGNFRITSASFMIAQSCNLACSYCYGGESGKYSSKTSVMNEDVAQKAIKRLVEDNANVENYITINFFGGEPLMNFKLIKFIVNECDNKYSANNFIFSITTNGTLITKEIATFFKDHNFKILVSIDGNEEIHDYHRKYPNGSGSYLNALKGIATLKEYNVEFRIRSTLDHQFYSKYFEIVEFLNRLGCDRVTIARLVKYEDDKLNFSLNIDHIKKEKTQLKKYLNKVEKEVMEGKTPCHFPYLSNFRKIIFAEKNLMSCGAYEGGTAISSDGKFYPCHRFVGMEGFDFGDVEMGVDKERLKKQTDNLDNSTKPCLNCFGKYICQRACIRDIAKSKGLFISYDDEYCDLLREAVDHSLILYYKLLKTRPDFFNTQLIIENEVFDNSSIHN